MDGIKTELHLHTREVSPCGRLSAKKAVRLCKQMGYQVVVITDHFTTRYFENLGRLPWNTKVDFWLRGYRRARGEGIKQGVKVLLGMEYCFPGTHDDMLLYGFDEAFLYDHENLYRLGPVDLALLAQEHGLLMIQAHPFRKKISKVYHEMVEGLEVFNGNPRHDSQNQKALDLARERRWIMLSGSDCHRAEDAGTGGVYLPSVPGDGKELVTLLRSHPDLPRVENPGERKKTLLERIFK